MVWAWKVCGLHQVSVVLAKHVGMYFLSHQKAPPSNQLPALNPACIQNASLASLPCRLRLNWQSREHLSVLISSFPALSAPQWLMAMALQEPGVQCTCHKEPAVAERLQVCHLACTPREPGDQPMHYRESIFVLLGKVWKHGSNGTTSELADCSQKWEFEALWTHCSRCKKKKFKTQCKPLSSRCIQGHTLAVTDRQIRSSFYLLTLF